MKSNQAGGEKRNRDRKEKEEKEKKEKSVWGGSRAGPF